MPGGGKQPGAGAKTSYRTEFADQARKLCLLGATNDQLAAFFEKDVQTIKNWLAKYEDFAEAVRQGKETADAEVASSLYHRALGYKFTEQQAIKTRDGVEVVQVERSLPPDTVACIFWLKNRRRKEWRDRHEHTGDEGGPIATEVVYRWADAVKDTPPEGK